jgi:phage FluMu protein Com
MAELISIGSQPSLPRVKCPHCDQINLIDIMAFREDVSKLMQDKCKHCNKDIYVAVLILGHTSVQLLLQLVQKIISTISSPHKIIG